MKHGGKFAFANFLANIFMLLGKVGLTVLNVFVTWMFMKHVTGTSSEVSNPYGPLGVVGLISYMIVSVFLGLFDEAVLAMMTSVTADMDMHGHPKWGPQSLHEVLDNLEEHPDDDAKPNNVS
jgi:hypothetical protein